MSNNDIMSIDGIVLEALGNAKFRVELHPGEDCSSYRTIIAHVSGKIRQNFIRILPQDRVTVEMSIYDLDKGRITRRL